ncbi:hypothetical protein SARC_00603 [Sphaeroforma arctica JP610]|uniref:Uncharacterized protein n=1 Tax=Sphaeroforma arctica JP610 TaxID=667725 RepID=A0A0L0GE38_9EUKA|nr:hypothetical protein SARC_00603 [Sphaeroforma arctica JP610]KNC87275.1 hypothetical protein SARC_00603 [Sphaeroforma arctica JP610]|eukprot:XP_014161177.1 hypothetical protein SARC_00603 [Sphaeroforma arctica JP610]
MVQEALVVRMRSPSPERVKGNEVVRLGQTGPVLHLKTPSPLRAGIGTNARSVAHAETESGMRKQPPQLCRNTAAGRSNISRSKEITH